MSYCYVNSLTMRLNLFASREPAVPKRPTSRTLSAHYTDPCLIPWYCCKYDPTAGTLALPLWLTGRRQVGQPT